MATIQLAIQGGVINLSGTIGIIDGFHVKKGSGNTAGTIEVGDFIAGYLTTSPARYIVGEVTALPYTTEGNITLAVDAAPL